MRSLRKAALGAATAALLAGTAACSSADDTAQDDSAAQEQEEPGQDGEGGEGGDGDTLGNAFEALQAAAAATEEITSAEFDGTISSPDMAGEAQVSGSMSWGGEQMAMGMRMSGEGLAADPELPTGELALIWLDETMYMDFGTDMFAELDPQYEGRNWLKMDLASMAEEMGDAEAADAFTYGMEEANQDPARQMALLLQSPDIEYLGEETLDGQTVDHYAGTVSVEEAFDAGAADSGLTEQEHQDLTDMLEQSGAEEYELEVWVNEDDFPVRIHQTYDTAQGTVESEMNYHNLGARIVVEPPPPSKVIDFMEILGGMAPEDGFPEGAYNS